MEKNICVHHRSLPEAKITLFRSLFRGREDVYPRRYVNFKTGKSGYAPACANEWLQGICEKPRIKCARCQHQRFLPVTDDVVRQHLAGNDDDGREFVMGVYPMLLDESCFFLAIDLNKPAWQEHARSVLATCHRLDIPVALERSRSGLGAHVWFFFSESIPAMLARKLGSYVLTECMELAPGVGLDSYDRCCPNQDTLPLASFGSLIALPLQKRAREFGNSVFLDDDLSPLPDQWAFLSSIRRMSRFEVEDVVRSALGRGRIVGVRLAITDDEEVAGAMERARQHRRREMQTIDALPASLDVLVCNEILVEKQSLPPALHNLLIRLAAFQNPEFQRAQAMHLSAYGKPRIVSCAQDYPHHIGLPRGCLPDVLQLLADLKVSPIIRDERYSGRPIAATFHGELTPDQQAAALAMLAHDTGVLSATTAFGKTVIGAWLIAKRRVNTLVLVHRRQLQDQWIDRLSTFLGLPQDAIGRIGGGINKPTGAIDVAIVQSLVRRGAVKESVRHYGQLIVDECHHLSARNFERVARAARAKFIAGLSATVTRKDGQHPIIFMQCGPVRHRVDAKLQAVARPFAHTAIVRPTGFRSRRAVDPDIRIQFQDLYDELIASADRNDLICREVIQAVRNGRSPIVLTERNDHLDALARRLSPEVRHLIVLRGGMNRREFDRTNAELAAIPGDEERVLLATGRYVGEGFDDARLDTLFLTLPVSWHGTVAQYVGRLHRLYHGKREVYVYDYADLDVGMLSRMFDRRCKGYEAVGYAIQLPASAVPGWPAEVALPVDPEWKGQYAASVRRLVRDGVDGPLGSLFAQVASAIPEDAEGALRARSATEAFLFRRLESLPQTTGRFRLNAELSIPFDGQGRMEVDLLCDALHLAIELDGGQHLGDAEAYRRDRRKDMLLQENGYLVLRFLAEDVGKRLDEILDAILRALANRRTRA
jgi:superfamily II DNA or RNA helicase/very-short-patch-repair endonuclease